MNKIIVFLCALCMTFGCSVELSETDDDSPYGSWIYTNGSLGAGGAIRENGTYTLLLLKVISSSTANVQLENGKIYVSPTHLTMTPTESTCPSTVESGSYSYRVENDVLTVHLPNGILAMNRNTAQASNNLVAVYGCFDKTGSFTQSRLVSVR